MKVDTGIYNSDGLQKCSKVYEMKLQCDKFTRTFSIVIVRGQRCLQMSGCDTRKLSIAQKVTFKNRKQ